MTEQELEQEIVKIKDELALLKKQNKQLRVDKKITLVMLTLAALSILSIKFELNFQDGKTSGSISSNDFEQTATKALEILVTIGAIGATGYSVPLALKSAQLSRTQLPPQSVVDGEEAKQ